MDNAHSAEYRREEKPHGGNNEIQKLKPQNSKLKEDYEKQIKTLKLEQRISTLELEKENQSLKHEMELMQVKFELESESKNDGELKVELKQQHEDFRKKIIEMEKQMVVKENEYKMKIKILENECQTKIKSLKDQYSSEITGLEEKLKDAVQRNESRQVTIEKLQKEVASLKRLVREEVEISNDQAGARINVVKDAAEERLQLGLERFYLRKVSSLTQTYQVWYNDVSRSLENLIPKYVTFDGKRFMFLKMEFKKAFTEIEILKRQNVPARASINGQNVENLYLYRNTDIKLLHPREFSKSLDLVKYENGKNKDYKWTERIWYDGFDDNTAIFLCVL